MALRVTFSPLTVEPEFTQAVADAMWQAQMQFLTAAWDAQLQFVQSLTSAALAAQWSLVAQLRQAHLHHD